MEQKKQPYCGHKRTNHLVILTYMKKYFLIHLIDYLSREGVYCIEDLYNNYAYWNSNAGRTTSSNKDGEEFDHLISGLNKQIHISSCMDAPDNFTEDYGSVLSIHTYSGLLIIKKGL